MEPGEPDSDFLALLGELDDRPEDLRATQKTTIACQKQCLSCYMLVHWAIGPALSGMTGTVKGGEHGLLRL